MVVINTQCVLGEIEVGALNQMSFIGLDRDWVELNHFGCLNRWEIIGFVSKVRMLIDDRTILVYVCLHSCVLDNKIGRD